MKRFVLVILLVCAIYETSIVWAKSQPQCQTEWIEATLHRIDTIKPGMTRAELETLFTTEGGLFVRERRTFVYRDCSYIKVDVEFDVSNRTPAEDVIKIISRPYLSWPQRD